MTHKAARIAAQAAFAGLLAILFQVTSFGQAITGSISGTVQDSSGAAVTSATVTLTEVATGVERKSSANDRGDFVLNGVPPGVYAAKIEASGFKTFVIPSINLTASEKLALPPTVLEVGATHETVTVTADAAVVQTASGERSSVLNSAQMDQLMDNGRSALSIITLMPGVVTTSSGGYNVSGLRRSQINITSDGINLMEAGSEYQTNTTVGMDAVSEIKVLTSNYQAEFGRKAGGSVQMVTKSGTRDFHGLFSYYKQNEEFNANTWGNNRVGVIKPIDRLNLYTFNIGGPVYIPHVFNTRKQKLFFFWNEEFRPASGVSALYQSTVPTAAERGGDFSQSTLKPKDPTTGAAYPGGIIPPSAIDPNGQALLKYLPAANFDNTAISRGSYNYVNQLKTHNPSRLDLVKIDMPVSSADSLSVNVTLNSANQSTPNPFGVSAGYPVVIGGLVSPRKFASVRYVHIFSPTLVNEITTGFTYGRTYDGTDPAARSVIQRSTVGFNVSQFSPAANPLNLIPGFSFGSAIPNSTGPTFDLRYPVDNGRRNLDFGDNLSKVYKNHSIKVGLYFERLWVIEGLAASNFPGTLDFSSNTANPFDTGNPYANALTGTFNRYQEASARPDPVMLANTIEWFAQDTWKVSRRLTLDYGLRFSIIQPWGEAANTMTELVPSLFDPSQAVKLIRPAIVNGARVGVSPVNGQVYPAALIGAYAPGSGNFLNGVIYANGNSGYPPQFMNGSGVKLGPRIGFAYDIFGNGKTAVRGGFGIGYDRVSDGLAGLNSTAGQYPLIQTPNVYYGKLSSFLSGSGFVFPANTVTLDKSGKIPAAYTMSLGVQQNLGYGVLLDVGYAGSLGRNLYWQQNLAPVPFGADFLAQNQDPSKPGSPLPATFLQAFPGYANVNLRDPGASSNYHSLQVSATRRFARGLQFGANWTWSKAMDFVDADTTAVSTLISPRIWNYGPAGFDRTHVLNINWLYDIPSGYLRGKVLTAILGHWQFNGIAAFISGGPLGVTAATTTGADITGSPTDPLTRANITGSAVLPKDKRSVYAFFNTSVFQLPALGTPGNAANTEFRGPGTNNWNMSLLKTFVALHERLHFEFRAEAYNVFNHTQYSTLDTTARFNPATGGQTNLTFGQVTAAASPRIMQMALRFLF
ncbi:MAG TPA: carboxypeptidase regulatory-like domain-containing protein [Bryobacteraceae bacterium]|nr:carboxypeptidase regulatory-like domain-containing protein [Bryobacteraceae bacterium]